MAVDPNKIKYGLSRLCYAPYTEGTNGELGTWGDPIWIPGAKTIDLTAQGNKIIDYADNMEYFVYTQSNGEAGNLVVEKYPEEFLAYALGWIIDENKALIKAANMPQGRFAILYEMQGNICPIGRVLFNCVIGAPSLAAKTTEAGIEVQPETAELTASNLDFGGLVASSLTLVRDKNPTAYENFFKKVLAPKVSNGTQIQGASVHAADVNAATVATTVSRRLAQVNQESVDHEVLEK